MASCKQFESQTCDDNNPENVCSAGNEQGKTVSVNCKAYSGLVLGIVDGKPKLVPFNIDKDESQKWTYFEDGGTVRFYSKDPSFKGRALHAEGNEVGFVKKDTVDGTVVWTEGKADDDGYKTSTKANSTLVWNAEEEGNITLKTLNDQDKQLWKIDTLQSK